jgi:hypothetical protein
LDSHGQTEGGSVPSALGKHRQLEKTQPQAMSSKGSGAARPSVAFMMSLMPFSTGVLVAFPPF